jgi:hypothetical protein
MLSFCSSDCGLPVQKTKNILAQCFKYRYYPFQESKFISNFITTFHGSIYSSFIKNDCVSPLVTGLNLDLVNVFIYSFTSTDINILTDVFYKSITLSKQFVLHTCPHIHSQNTSEKDMF